MVNVEVLPSLVRSCVGVFFTCPSYTWWDLWEVSPQGVAQGGSAESVSHMCKGCCNGNDANQVVWWYPLTNHGMVKPLQVGPWMVEPANYPSWYPLLNIGKHATRDSGLHRFFHKPTWRLKDHLINPQGSFMVNDAKKTLDHDQPLFIALDCWLW